MGNNPTPRHAPCADCGHSPGFHVPECPCGCKSYNGESQLIALDSRDRWHGPLLCPDCGQELGTNADCGECLNDAATTVLRRRTPGEQQAYLQGWEAGWRYMLGRWKEGQTPDDAEKWCASVTDTLRNVTDNA